MAATGEEPSEVAFQAYLTSEAGGGPRIPIVGERIVVVLGEDEVGHPLEVSIVLKKREHQPRLTVYAIREPIDLNKPWTHLPRMVVKTCARNVLQLGVDYEPIMGSQPRSNVNEHSVAKKQPPATGSEAWCSFCRVSYRDAGPFIEGPGNVYICHSCVGLCADLVEQERKRRAASP